MPTEVLVIDNGSVDHTPKVVERCSLPNGSIRHVVELRPGQCYARNRGLSEGKGDVFLFTDDDVRLPRNWIEGMCRPIAQGRANAVAGGVIFPPNHQAALSREPYKSRRDWFASTENIDPNCPDRMVGANMAFGRDIFESVGAFDTNLGPGALGFFDETLFAYRLMDKGFKLIGALDVPVEHHFDLSRLTLPALFDIAYRMGQSAGYVAWHWKHRGIDEPWSPARARLALMRRQIQNFIDRGASLNTRLQRTFDIGWRRQLMIERRNPPKYQRKKLEPVSA
jgi:glycosyltransferase involved in cell wall biosynthesis